jgi:hypothetical protein
VVKLEVVAVVAAALDLDDSREISVRQRGAHQG